jgi:hypothetical protein
MKIIEKPDPSVAEAVDQVRSSEFSDLLNTAAKHDIPIRFNTSMSPAGRYSFKFRRREDGGKPEITDRRIELNPSAPNARGLVLLSGVLVHELKHAEDIDGQYANCNESDRPELERRAERAQGDFVASRIARALIPAGRAA